MTKSSNKGKAEASTKVQAKAKIENTLTTAKEKAKVGKIGVNQNKMIDQPPLGNQLGNPSSTMKRSSGDRLLVHPSCLTMPMKAPPPFLSTKM